MTGRRWPELARRAAGQGLEGDALLSTRPGELAELAQRAISEGASLLVVVGGDGSVNEVVNGLTAVNTSGVELAVIPRGSGEDFVRTYGIPRATEDAVAVAREGCVRQIDLGRATYRSWAGEQGSAAFANIASAGMSGAIAKRANEATKALGGKVSYLWATFAVFSRWQHTEVSVTVGEERRQGRMYDVIVANGRYFGGGMMICPDAQPDDGLFDVLMIGDLTKSDLLLTLPKSYRGHHLPHPKAELLRGSRVTVDAAERLPVELDGEQPGTTPARFEIARRALRLRVPR